MIKNVIIFVLALTLIVTSYISYIYGYYTGASKSILFDGLLEANYSIHAIDCIKSGKYDKAITTLNASLETNIDSINDISSSLSKPNDIIKRYSMYKERVSLDTSGMTKTTNDKYNNLLNKYNELKP